MGVTYPKFFLYDFFFTIDAVASSGKTSVTIVMPAEESVHK
jgi:hypothetical protein